MHRKRPHSVTYSLNNRELKHGTFLSLEQHAEISFLLSLSSHYYIHIRAYLFTSRDYLFENLGETTVLAGEIFTSGFLNPSATACKLLVLSLLQQKKSARRL